MPRLPGTGPDRGGRRDTVTCHRTRTRTTEELEAEPSSRSLPGLRRPPSPGPTQWELLSQVGRDRPIFGSLALCRLVWSVSEKQLSVFYPHEPEDVYENSCLENTILILHALFNS